MIIKSMSMSAVEMREQVHQLVDEIDERLLKAVLLMMSSYQNEEVPIGYETDGSPVTASVFLKQAETAVAEAKKGKGITVEELEKRSAQWLERMK